MRNVPDWKFPTNARSRHPSAEGTRRLVREERVLTDLERWRSGTRSRPRVAERRRLPGLLRALALLLLLGALAALGASVLLGRVYRDRIYPEVVAGDVPVGSLTAEEATQKLEARLEPYLDEPLTLQLGQTTWQPSADDIGLSIDVPATVRMAAERGREAPLLAALGRTLLGRARPVTVPFVMSLDQRQLGIYLQDIAREVNQDPIDPRVVVRGGQVSVETGGQGYSFLRDETESNLRSAVARLSRGPVAVEVYTSQGKVSPESIRRAADQVRKVVSGPVLLEAGGQRWEIQAKQLGEWVRTGTRAMQGNAAEATVTLDPVEVRSYLTGIARELNRPARNVRLQWNQDEVQVTQPSEQGQRLDVDEAAAAIQRAALGDNRVVRLPVKPVIPEIAEASVPTLGIREQLGVGETDFRGTSAAHERNVRLASDAITGYVVPPGAEFSFAQAVGRVGESEGYRPELVDDGERGLQGPWTGISQVSTAAFRAAFNSGLQVSERHASPYRVQWLEQGAQQPGLDAVVTLPGEDLRFVNDTNSAILVQTVVGEGEMRVELYGTKGGRKVDVEPPVVSVTAPPGGYEYWDDPGLRNGEVRLYASAEEGAEVTVRRTIRRPGEPPEPDTVFSRYEPLPTIYARGER